MAEVRIGGSGSVARPFGTIEEYRAGLGKLERGSPDEVAEASERLRLTDQATLDAWNNQILPGGGGREGPDRRGGY